MERKTLDVGTKLTLHILDVPGDLRLTGWNQQQIKAKTNGSRLDLDAEGETVNLSCDHDLIVSVPQDAEIEIETVGGDASLRVLDGTLSIRDIGGDLALRNVNTVSLGKISGDLVLRHAGGSVTLEALGGDASLRDIHGAVALQHIGGDLHVRDLYETFHAAVEGDVIANLKPFGGAAYDLQAGGDVLVRLPADADVTLALAAGGELEINLPGIEEKNATALVIGLGDSPMNISAGGDLLVTSHADEWAEHADFDISMPFIGADFPGLPDDFAEKIGKQAEEAARKAEAAARKIEKKVILKSEKYIRDAERHASRAARHAERSIRFGKVPAPPTPPRPPRRPEPPSDPVSDQERMLILKMLEEKKITAAEAEKLLAAME